MTAATHNVPVPARTDTSGPNGNYAERRAARATKRQQREAKRGYEHLKGVLRSQLRKQVDQIATENGKNLIFALLNQGRLQVSVSIEMPQSDAPAVTDVPADPVFSDDVQTEPLIKIVPR